MALSAYTARGSAPKAKTLLEAAELSVCQWKRSLGICFVSSEYSLCACQSDNVTTRLHTTLHLLILQYGHVSYYSF